MYCRIFLLLSVVASALAASGPTIDLGAAGKYIGVLQNNGTVESWKGIPYATPPVGNLRFKAPVALASRKGVVADVSDDALRCIQFGGASNIVGVKAGPGVEDCLKLWIWKPVTAKSGDKLPVSVYIHGGGLQFSAAANNDFSDWVGQEQNFIAVNVAYRLGGFGFMASDALTAEGQHANAGLLDMRMAFEWVQANIDHFGGDASKITIMGQSGGTTTLTFLVADLIASPGGYAIVSQLALYDGKGKLPFQQACARSVQRSPMFAIAQHKERNDRLYSLLNCTAPTTTLACFRNASATDFVAATNSLSSLTNAEGLAFGGFLPSIDGVTLTDTISKLWLKGKIASVPFIGGYVTNEGGGVTASTTTTIDATTIGAYNFTPADVAQVARMYPVNASFSDASGAGNFFADGFRAVIQSAAGFGEGGIAGSEHLVNTAMCAVGNCARTWGFRFAAPTVGTTYADPSVPLSLVNATAVMTAFEKKIALEWRAYIGSFIRTGNPNTQKLRGAVHWPTYQALGDGADPLRLVPTFAYASNADPSLNTSTTVEIMPKAQQERSAFWLSDATLAKTKL
ncbi:Alpha/Beta hydrolase protein [Mycena epipterygia]|nr:Alpha/Beta hydrolase protein [Mycena epipterygia]